METLITQILSQSPKGFQTREDPEIIANRRAPYGSKIYVDRNGEYFGFEIQVLQNTKGKLSSTIVASALKIYFIEEDIYKAAHKLFLNEEEGTYGLNDLVYCDTILSRPPDPDKLPQMKGRLDRLGQKENVLQMIYFVIENTIEEALLLRLEVANKFFNNHIMPLAQFYDLAVGRTKLN